MQLAVHVEEVGEQTDFEMALVWQLIALNSLCGQRDKDPKEPLPSAVRQRANSGESTDHAAGSGLSDDLDLDHLP